MNDTDRLILTIIVTVLCVVAVAHETSLRATLDRYEQHTGETE